MTPTSFEAGGRKIGPGNPVFIVAEMSANHHQSYEEAVRIIHAAHEAGADAVKIQTYTADTLTLKSNSPWFQVKGGTLWDGTTLHELYQKAYTPWEWQPKLKAEADKLGILFFSAPFDFTAVDFLEPLNLPLYKIASFEIVDLPLIERVAATGKPIIISTGMANFEEIKDAVDCARQAGARDIALLKCTSAYPAPASDMNLQTIPNMIQTFGLPIGISDHTMGIHVPVAAVALGACILEKHFTISRSVSGPDSAFSLEPQEFKAMVEAVRETEKALGRVFYGVNENEKKSKVFRRSLFVVEAIKAGDIFTPQNLKSIRPGNGLPPKFYKQILGQRASKDIPKGTPLDWPLVSGIPAGV